jgi:pilus assembly protein TadC
MSERSDMDYDWIGKKEDENMAERINEWGDPVERESPAFPFVVALVFLLLIWLSGVAMGAYLMGWRPL